MWAAQNIHLWLKRERDAVKAAAARLRKQRLRPRRSSLVAVVVGPDGQPADSRIETASRAP
ncbi:MAG: hypothetical protein ACRENX_06250 [Candidatus Dormibacteria bacterium]